MRKFTENVLQNTSSCTIDKKSEEYVAIPLNIVCAVIHYLLFLYKNKYFCIFFYNILAKYSPKRTKLHHFLKNSRGSMSPNPPSKRVATPRAMQIPPLFQKYFEPPPPRNEILDTPLSVGDSDRQYTIILYISNIFLPTILKFLNDRERGRHYLL